MSGDDNKNVVMKGVTHGACDYLIKPVQIDPMKNVWQHVVRKKKNEWRETEQSGSAGEGDQQQKPSEDAYYSSSANEGSSRSSRKRRDEDEDVTERDEASALKKPRVVWSVDRHQQFVSAVNQLGIDNAVPKKILELMNTPELTRENVASHLQKYRIYLKRVNEVPQHPNNSFLNQQDASFGSTSSTTDLQTLAASGKLPAQSPATFQAAGLGRSTANAGVPMPLMDERNLFNFENLRLGIGEGQQQHLSRSKSIDLLNGIPTAMEPNQLVNLHQSIQSIGNLNMGINASTTPSNPLLMQMPQSLPFGQPNRNIAPALNSPMLSFPINQTHQMPITNFPLGNTPPIYNAATKGAFQDEVTFGIKGDTGFVTSYDTFNEIYHYKSNEHDLTAPGLTYTASQTSNPLHSNIHYASPSSLVQHEFYSTPQTGQSRDPPLMDKAFFFPDNLHNADQHLNKLADNSERVNVERIPDERSQTNLFPENYGQEDLLSALLKQQEGIEPVENGYDFDGYSLDNIPV